MRTPMTAQHIKRVRREILVALKMLYPAALQADQLLRSLLAIFPTLEWDHFRKDVAYLTDKGYLARVHTDTEGEPKFTRWRKRWFRLTPAGVEVADQCVHDRALDV